MRLCVVLALVGGCTFGHGTQVRDAAEDGAPDTMADAPIDAAPAFCAPDPHLRLCFSFDQDPLLATIPNEGAANVSATLVGVTRGPGAAGGAALLDTSSSIHVPYTADVSAIKSVELWFRADAPPPANLARIGLFDSNVLPPNISLFWYRADPQQQLRCGLGSALFTYNTMIGLGAWHHVACICDADTLQLYLDGTKIGETPASGCASGGALVAAGLTIGSNNNGGPTGVTEWLVGAIDGVRLWDVPVQGATDL